MSICSGTQNEQKVHTIPNSVQSSLPPEEFNIQSVVLNPKNKSRSHNDPCLLLNYALSIKTINNYTNPLLHNQDRGCCRGYALNLPASL